MNTVSLIGFIINLFCAFSFSVQGIKKSKKGKIFIEGLESQTFDFLRWRSISKISADLKKLSKVFGIASILGMVLVGLSGLFNVQPGIYFTITVLLSLMCWVSLNWGTNKRKETLEWFKYLGLLLIGPWLFYLFDLIGRDASSKILPIFGDLLNTLFGFTFSSNLNIAIALTIILFCCILVLTFFWFLQNIIVLYVFVIMLWGINYISTLLLKLKGGDKISIIVSILYPIGVILTFISS